MGRVLKEDRRSTLVQGSENPRPEPKNKQKEYKESASVKTN
jgi:hypothetical protein